MLTIATGNKAVACAVKDATPGVIAAYPITPQTEIVEQIAEYVTNGELKSMYIPVESEHSAMAACIGASITGTRTFTATSSHGLLYMHEMVNWAAGARLPIVMANVKPSSRSWLEYLGRTHGFPAGTGHRMAPGICQHSPGGLRCDPDGLPDCRAF